MSVERVLEAAGIDDVEEEVYLVLLRSPAAPVADIARSSGLSSTAVRRALAALEVKGLVARAAGRTLLYNPIPPDVAIGALLRKREAELERARRHSIQLMEEFRSRGGGRSLNELVEVIFGLGAVSQLVPQLEGSAEREVAALSKPPYLSGPVDDPVATGLLLSRGVRITAIYDRSALEVPGLVEAVARDVRLGEEARIVDEVPLKVLIVDRQTAILPLMAEVETTAGALLVHPSALLDALLYVFDVLWERSVPLRVSTDQEQPLHPRVPEEAERVLVGFLAAGFSDEAIAARLTVSPRTIRRRVLELMKRYGVKTRFQLAATLTKEGRLE